MNVYDFDKTIYKKDSTLAFYFFCLRKNPCLLRFLFVQAWYYLLYRLHIVEKKRFKEIFFSFFSAFSDGVFFDSAILRGSFPNKIFSCRFPVRKRTGKRFLVGVAHSLFD